MMSLLVFNVLEINFYLMGLALIHPVLITIMKKLEIRLVILVIEVGKKIILIKIVFSIHCVGETKYDCIFCE